MTTLDRDPASAQGEVSVPDDRFVPLRQVFNLRDLGGLSTVDGGRVTTGLVYRSDQFGNACDSDIAHLVRDRGVRTVVDLRLPVEIAATGSFPERDGVRVLNLGFRHLRWDLVGERVGPDESPVPFLVERYTAMIETGAEEIRTALELMCDDTPLVFHCMAGKDRTGITAAVALKLLGVADDDIAADYALTRYGMARYRGWMESNGRTLHGQWGLEPVAEAMHGLLDNIDRTFGSIDSYAKAIGFDDTARLRDRLIG